MALVAAIALATIVLARGAETAQAASPPAGSAVYISLGDGIQWGCCVDPGQSADMLFARYLSNRLNRDVEWVSLARNDRASFVTTDILLNGSGGQESQINALETALAEYRREGRPVVAITLSVGGNNLVRMGRQCQSPPCTELYQQALSEMTPQLEEIYQRINALKESTTPLLVLTYYNASDCGQPGVGTSPTELGVRGWDAAIEAAVKRNGAFLVDGYTPFKGRACQLVGGLDLNPAGHQVMEKQYELAYASLPAEYVDPFRKSGANLWLIAVVLAGAAAAAAALVWIARSRAHRTAAKR